MPKDTIKVAVLNESATKACDLCLSKWRSMRGIRRNLAFVHQERLQSAPGLVREGFFNIARHLAELDREPREGFPLRRVRCELANNGTVLRVIAKLSNPLLE